jgi:hypothetical protein
VQQDRLVLLAPRVRLALRVIKGHLGLPVRQVHKAFRALPE